MWINIAAFWLGFMSWSAAEYVMHRFVGHRKRSRARFAKEHTRHHAKPGYFTSHKTKVITASQILGPAGLILTLITGWSGLIFTVGFASAYMTYEWTHYSFHTYPPRTFLGRILRKHHFAHHFHNPSINHGVTSRIWDRVFRTYQPITIVHIPEHSAAQSMPWVIDPVTKDIKECFQNDYAIRRRKQ